MGADGPPRLQRVPVPSSHQTMLCDMTTGFPALMSLPPSASRSSTPSTIYRIPGSERRKNWSPIGLCGMGLTGIFARGPKHASKLMSKCKVNRHTKTPPPPLGTFTIPKARFDHVHIDIVGPLPPSEGHSYLLTCVDRYTRWPEAFPMGDISAETVSRVFVTHCMGCPFWCPLDHHHGQGSPIRSTSLPRPRHPTTDDTNTHHSIPPCL